MPNCISFLKNAVLSGSLLLGFLFCACGYKYYTGPLRPLPELQQRENTVVSDDGTVTFILNRLEVGVRPQTDAELNRLYAPYSTGGIEAINPYTFGDWRDPETQSTPHRFTVFQLTVKNYAYPKILIDPSHAWIITDNGRKYRALGPLQLAEYYRPYATAYAGNEYRKFRERKDIFSRTRYKDEPVFSGQETQGFLVFPLMHADVQKLRIKIENVAVRFDFRAEPVETLDLEYLFERDIGRIYPGETEVIVHAAG